MNDHDDLYRLSGAYALNALDDDERVPFEDLLAESEELRTEVTELSDTAVLLGLSARPIAPSPELKTNLMAMLASTPQLPAESASTQAPAASETLAPASVAPSLDDQRKIRRLAGGEQRSHRATTKANARWFSRPTGVLLASAAALALVVGGIGGALIGVASSSDPLEQLASAQDLEVTPTADVDGGGTVTLMSSDELDRSAIAVSDLPDLSAGEVYQLWYIDDAGAVSAGLLSDRLQLLEGRGAVDDSFGMTVEPAGGSDAPTSDPIVLIGQA